MFSGVIEGFYGKTWTWQQRRHMLEFLQQEGFSHYIYAPKSDRFLRNDWQMDWPQETFAELLTLSQTAQKLNLHFGVGLSPISLVDNWGEKERDILQKRLQQIAQLNLNTLAILFDDIKGDKADLATRQIDIVLAVQEVLPNTQLLMCPTYYSFDPILPELFGAMPHDYWQQLGQGLPASVEVLWTGDKVISNDYPIQSLENISQLLQRKPVIWDNSRVNDGRKTSPFIPLKAMFNLSDLHDAVNGVLINPMNQMHLACVNLKTLRLLGDADARLHEALQALAPEVYRDVIHLLAVFTEQGVDGLSKEDNAMIYKTFNGKKSAIAEEILQWLNGDYRFDPACLT